MKKLSEIINDSSQIGVKESTEIIALFNDITAKKTMVIESSMNRIIQWLTNCDCAFISGFRERLTNIHDSECTWYGDDDKWEPEHEFTHEENRERNKYLYCHLMGYGYGIMKVKGIYPEGMSKETSEESYLVFNRNGDPDFYGDTSKTLCFEKNHRIPNFWYKGFN